MSELHLNTFKDSRLHVLLCGSVTLKQTGYLPTFAHRENSLSPCFSKLNNLN